MVLQFAGVVIGLGFAITVVAHIKAAVYQRLAGPRVQYVDLLLPFVYRWALYSAAVAFAALMSFAIAAIR